MYTGSVHAMIFVIDIFLRFLPDTLENGSMSRLCLVIFFAREICCLFVCVSGVCVLRTIFCGELLLLVLFLCVCWWCGVRQKSMPTPNTHTKPIHHFQR